MHEAAVYSVNSIGLPIEPYALKVSNRNPKLRTVCISFIYTQSYAVEQFLSLFKSNDQWFAHTGHSEKFKAHHAQHSMLKIQC